tara:strand:- start:220 stop:747 length:528 start_codon:yes stop_codon:yes gene_type:complete
MIDLPSLGKQKAIRPVGICLHAMAEYLDLSPFDQHAYEFLKAQGLGAHYLITPSGDTLNCADPTEMCYHAKGFNRWEGTRGDVGLIGIEILVPGCHTYGSFTDAIKEPGWCGMGQWHETVELVKALKEEYDLKLWLKDGRTYPWLVRHSDISPGRKVDPGAGFDYQAMRKATAGL